MAKRKIPEVNAGSMADIAFLLLIFFLVTTTMDVDTGLIRKLPPPPQKNAEPPKVKERNGFMVLINKDNMLAIKGNPAEVSELRERVKEFIVNPTMNENLSEKIPIQQKLDEELSKEEPNQKKIQQYKEILKEFGPDTYVSAGVVSLQNDRGTYYGKYIQVQNEIVGAFNDLRNELANILTFVFVNFTFFNISISIKLSFLPNIQSDGIFICSNCFVKSCLSRIPFNAAILPSGFVFIAIIFKKPISCTNFSKFSFANVFSTCSLANETCLPASIASISLVLICFFSSLSAKGVE